MTNFALIDGLLSELVTLVLDPFSSFGLTFFLSLCAIFALQPRKEFTGGMSATTMGNQWSTK